MEGAKGEKGSPGTIGDKGKKVRTLTECDKNQIRVHS